MQNTKTCPVCGRTQSLTSFYSNVYTADGLRRECQTCTKRLAREDYATNRDVRRAQSRARMSSLRSKRRTAALTAAG